MAIVLNRIMAMVIGSDGQLIVIVINNDNCRKIIESSNYVNLIGKCKFLLATPNSWYV